MRSVPILTVVVFFSAAFVFVPTPVAVAQGPPCTVYNTETGLYMPDGTDKCKPPPVCKTNACPTPTPTPVCTKGPCLPVTGLDLALVVGVGFALLVAGLSLRRWQR